MTPPLLKQAPASVGSSEFRKLLVELDATIDHMPAAVLREITPALLELRRELARDLERWLTPERWGSMVTSYSTQRSVAALAQVRVAIMRATGPTGAAMRAVAREADLALIRGGFAAGRLGIEHMIRQVEAREGEFGHVIRLDLDTAQMLTSQRQLLVQRFERSAARYGENGIEAIRGQLLIGVVRNETFAELTRRIMALGNGPKLVGMPAVREISEGLWRQQYGSAWRLVRTEVMKAYNDGHQRALTAAHRIDPELKKQWDAANDGACPECRRLDGDVVEVSQNFSNGESAPPAHPHCRCRIVPMKDAWRDTNGGGGSDGD